MGKGLLPEADSAIQYDIIAGSHQRLQGPVHLREEDLLSNGRKVLHAHGLGHVL